MWILGEIAGCRLSPWPTPHGWGAIPRHRNQTRSRGGSKSRWLGPGPARCLFCSRSSLCRKERTYSPTVQLAPAVIGRGGLAKGNAGGAGGAVAVLAVQAVRRCGDAAAWRRGGSGVVEVAGTRTRLYMRVLTMAMLAILTMAHRCEAVRACRPQGAVRESPQAPAAVRASPEQQVVSGK